MPRKTVRSLVAASALMALVAFVGLLDAAYLATKHFQGEAPPCSIVRGCEAVAMSEYASVGPIPVAAAGAAYYLVILVLAVTYLDSRRLRAMKCAGLLSGAGLAASAYLTALQVFVIGSFCIWCLGSAITSTLIFALGLAALFIIRKHGRQEA